MTLEQLQVLFPDATSETWYQHSNGGGWVENTTEVDATAYMGPKQIQEYKEYLDLAARELAMHFPKAT